MAGAFDSRKVVELPDRRRIMQILLVLYALGSLAMAVPLLFYAGAGNLAETTSGRILASALLSLGLGAVAASRDPWRHRIVVQMLIAFTTMAALSIAFRLAMGYHEDDPAWFLLPIAACSPVLLAIFYPRRPGS
jgi:peptidoglycan/LPS O-acetylase OafA/YrhL